MQRLTSQSPQLGIWSISIALQERIPDLAMVKTYLLEDVSMVPLVLVWT